ncbi:Hypothetical predicted protein [Lecanosticta acicola]|uniref:Uncharacterized protein n=1 Tax=Lecanosticta acicola TaxID=111012 RepID=A0AAI8YST9_9PEZI|nr:Hypothetical predicted protein [Lecanosticta acicola]
MHVDNTAKRQSPSGQHLAEQQNTSMTEFASETTSRRAEARETNKKKEEEEEDLPHNSKAEETLESTTAQSDVIKSSRDAEERTQNIGTIRTVVGCGEEEAARWLQQGGTLPQAILLALDPARAVQAASANQSESCGVPEPKAPTLLEEALAAYRTKPLQKGGDTFVILDGTDLARSCRLSSENIIEAVPVLERQLIHPPSSGLGVDVDGIKHLLVLKKAVNGMPLLSRLSLNTMREDCEDVLHKKASGEGAGAQIEATETGIKSEKLTQVKHELLADMHDSAAPDAKSAPARSAPVDWIAGYESFLRIISHVRPQYYGISQSNIDTALAQIEGVAKIAHSYKAAGPGSVVEESIESLLLKEFSFNRVNHLWNSIAKDAARWLVVAVHLECSLLYKEAFIHVAGCYPNWPWNVSRVDMEKQVPTSVTSAIATKSQVLAFLRAGIERELFCSSITFAIDEDEAVRARVGPDNGPRVWMAVSCFREWLAAHLWALDGGIPSSQAICSHDKGCRSTSGICRLLARGGDSYLPLNSLLDKWDYEAVPKGADFEELIDKSLIRIKKFAAKAVQPLVKNSLRGKKRDLEYLTCIEVSAEDIPWEKE